MITREMATSLKGSIPREDFFNNNEKPLGFFFRSAILEVNVSAVNENLCIRGHLEITRTITRGVRGLRTVTEDRRKIITRVSRESLLRNLHLSERRSRLVTSLFLCFSRTGQRVYPRIPVGRDEASVRTAAE